MPPVGRVSIAFMTERGQVWTGFAPSLLTFLATLILPTSGWEAATLVATAIVVSLCAAQRRVIVPRLPVAAGSVVGPAAAAAPVLCRLGPDAPGRPRPRAPGWAIRARPV